jgi:hypothetical protein
MGLLMNILRILILIIVIASLILGITKGNLFSLPPLSILVTLCIIVIIPTVLIDGLMGKKIPRLDLLRWIILLFIGIGFLGSIVFNMKFGAEVFVLFIPMAAVLIYDLRKQ